MTSATNEPAAPGRILVGLDGSPLAQTILGPVRALATRLGAEIVLLHVAPAPESLHAAARRAGVALDEVIAQERAGAASYLEGVARALRDGGLRVRTATTAGDAAAEIVRYAAREGIELVALATHGRSGVQRWVHGSVADAVLHTATTPLLLMRPDEGAATPFEVRRIAVALDGSELAEAALPIAERLARALAVPLVLVRIVELSSLVFAADPTAAAYIRYNTLFEWLRDDAESYVAARAEELRAHGASVETVVGSGTAAEAIVAQARTHPGTLLVLGTHGRTGWRAVALGSVARRVVALATSPVLIVRPDAASAS